MRIGIDARQLCGEPTGVGRYLGGLIHEWANDERARRHEFILYVPEPPSATIDTRRFATRTVPGSPGTLWEQVRVPRVVTSDHLDVFFAPEYTAPLALRVPTVVAIHDVSYFAHPQWFRTREGIRLRWFSRHAAVRASAVITISQFSRREIAERMGVPNERLHVIPPGIGSLTTTARRSGAPRVLFVGSIFNRRHVPDLIRAFAPIARAHPDAALDIVGDNRSYPREDLERTIAAEHLDGRARWLRYVDEDQLRMLYGQARAFAFLSEYEGLGLTPLEALAAGVPPVLLDTPVARETCGNAALYVPLGDSSATTRALERALFDEPTRARLLAAAPEELRKYNWPRAAAETLTVIEKAAHMPRAIRRGADLQVGPSSRA